MTTTPSEEAIRAACAEAGISKTMFGYMSVHPPLDKAILTLARRIEAEQAAVPVATVHVTHGGYSMRLAIHSAHVLPEGNDIPPYAHPPTDRERVAELEAALNRQCDNMAFALNKATLPDQWYCKFTNELEQDRQALKGTGNVE
jgi:hypothetical protein